MSKTQLHCNTTQTLVDYHISRGFDLKTTADMEVSWAHEKGRIVQQLISDNPAAQTDRNALRQLIPEYGLEDWNWKWLEKALHCNTPEFEWFYLHAENQVQAAAIIYHPKTSRLNNDHIFYLDYLATAYWNRMRKNYTRRFSGLGPLLLAYAINYAFNHLKYRPGFCLHSLPGAEIVYKKWGMVDLGIDPGKEHLRYFEATEDVSKILAGRQP